ncbi:hypothetical protein ABEB36_009824 [Hypothenemus hampei]|uniref:Uncharacterized protein n=1 Tax=Hypothenemus hampei TaxID=57062 RepID=A0ABD1EKJ7_HYPHA
MLKSSCIFRVLKLVSQKNYSQKVQHDAIFNYLQGRYEGIAVIGFNRPSHKNAINTTLVSDLYRFIETVNYENVARVLILRSMVSNIFCAGADLKERSEMTFRQTMEFVTNLRGLMSKLDNVPIPVLAAIDGAALGGGLEISLACDIRVASTDAKLGLVETKLAIIPGAGGTQRLPRIVGPSVAKELIYTSRIINGKTAFNLGLINHCVEQDESGQAAYNKCLEIAEEILPNGPVAVRLAKQAINRGIEVDLHSGLSIEEACYAQVVPTKDRLEGLLAFKEKRKPQYDGH